MFTSSPRDIMRLTLPQFIVCANLREDLPVRKVGD